jgi:predicted esterase YcpF (UPF0227 family)
MKRKKKILFVYGYNDSPESPLIDILKKSLKDEYNIISDYYAQYRPIDALKDLDNIVKTQHPNIVIGVELGGFLAAFLHNKKVKKILINPIIDAVEELQKYEGVEKDDKGNDVVFKLVPEYMIDFYKDFGKKIDFVDPMIHIISNKEKEFNDIIEEDVKSIL